MTPIRLSSFQRGEAAGSGLRRTARLPLLGIACQKSPLRRRGIGTGAERLRFLEWLAAQQGNPYFWFLHSFDIHSDFRPEPRFAALFGKLYQGPVDGSTRELIDFLRGELELDTDNRAHLVDLYDAEIRQLDHALEDLFAKLRESGALDLSVVVVKADRGEEIFDLAEDPHERVNLATAEPERTADLANELSTTLGSVRPAPVLPRLTPVTRRQLEALGYLRE